MACPAAGYTTNAMFRIIPHRLFFEPEASVLSAKNHGETATAALRIDGLLCSACAAHVRRRLQRVDGVRTATVDLQSGQALVTYDPARATPEALIAAVEGAVLFPRARRLLAAAARGQHRRSGSSDPDDESARV